MKILLVYPAGLDEQNRPIKYKRAFIPPLSLAILDSLTPSGHSVRVVNDLVEDVDYSENYDLVGLTAMTPQSERAYQIADTFRSRGKAKVVMGGIHPTMLPQEAKQHADSVVIGEAENLWRRVLDDCESDSLKDYYQEASFPDLQELVVPKWDNMNMRIYPRRIGSRLPMMPIYTTRGCPFNCRFCTVTKFFGRTHRSKPVPHVIEEIKRTGRTDYFFVDDNIASDVDHSRELFTALSGRNINWFSQASVTMLNHPEMIEMAAKAGCSYLFIGVESLNPESLKGANKRFNRVERYEELVARMHEAGIMPLLSFVFGFDEDTPDQFRLTLEFLKKNKVGLAFFFILIPLPGSDLYTEMDEQGRIEEKCWSRYDAVHVVYTPRNGTRRELEQQYWKSYQELYSIKNVARNTWHNSIRANNPVREFFRSLFFQAYFRTKVRAFEHPVSGGIHRVPNTALPGLPIPAPHRPAAVRSRRQGVRGDTVRS